MYGDDVNIPKSAFLIAAFNTIGALIAAFTIIPAVFSFGIDLSSGPSFLFISLPEIFATIKFGRIMEIMFFFSVILATFSSSIGMLEGPVEALMSLNKSISRKVAVIILTLISMIVAIPLSLNMKWFENFADINTIILSPLAALLVAIIFFCGFNPTDISNILGSNKMLKKK